MPNIVFIGTSLDGYIADREGKLDFLQSVPNPENLDFGFYDFMDRIDALIMGRKTFETVLGFGGEWPYSKPVFVLSSSLTSIPDDLTEKVEIISGPLVSVVEQLNQNGFKFLYIDGGQVIQSFLNEDMIDELIISRVPTLLGGGTPLFGLLPQHLEFEHVNTEVLLNAIVKSHYKRLKQQSL